MLPAAIPVARDKIMKDRVKKTSGSEELRRQAEERLKSRTAVLEKISPEEAQNLLQELHVHQVELEMQNDQLRQTQAELETALTRYTDLYDFAPVAYLTLDERGWIIEANLTAARLLGTERRLLFQQPLAPFIRPEDIKQFWAYLVAVIQGQAAPPLELNLLVKGGAEVAVQLDSLLVPDAASHPQVRTSLVDVTARYKAENALQELKNHYQTLFYTASDAIFISDLEGRLLEANEEGCRRLGYTREELLRLTVHDVTSPEYFARRPEILEQLRAEGKLLFETELVTRDGRIIPCECSSCLTDLQGRPAVFSITRDISERKAAAKFLRESEARFRLSIENAPDAIFVQTQHRFAYLNPAAIKLFGAESADQLLGQPVLDRFDPSFHDKVRERIRLLNQEKKAVLSMEQIYLKMDGSPFYVEVNAAPIYWGDHEGALVFFRDITARKQSEESLALYAARIQALLDLHLLAQAPTEQILDFVLEISLQVTRSQHAWVGMLDEAESVLTIHGWSKEVMSQCTITDKPILFPVAEGGLWGDCIRQRTAVLVNDYPALHPGKRGLPEGHVPMRRFLVVPALDAGRVVAVVMVANKAEDYTEGDITALTAMVNKTYEILRRKQDEEQLKHLQRQLELILNSTWEAVIELDLSGAITFANPATTRLLGFETQEMMGQDAHLLFHSKKPNGSHHPEEECPIQTSIKEGTLLAATEDVFCRKDGAVIPVEYTYSPSISEGLRVGGILSFWDITARKEAEWAFKSLISHAPLGVYIAQDGKFVMINPGFEAITGYREEELLGKETLLLVLPEDKGKVREKAIGMLKKEVLLPYEFQVITKSGETRWVLETVASTRYKNQRATLGYFLDINEQKCLEKQFLQAQKMEAVGRLAGGVAHDFNNLLSVIFGYGDLMNQTLRPQDPLGRYLEKIREASDRAASLTSQLLAFSRKAILVPEILNLNDQLSGIEGMLSRLIGEDIEIRIVLEPALGAVQADPGYIEQIVMNLAVNARDAMPKGGKLTLETANVYLDEDYVRRHAHVTSGHYVRLAVTDNGQGMDAATQTRVFEPFFTTKELGRGTGLGLSTVYGLVKQSSGYIEVYSEVGHGTTFKVYLPRVQEAVAAVSAAKPITKDLHGSETILVVEDEDMLREIITRSLKIHGYTVLVARHGGEALLCCERHPGTIHLLLTDVVMPQMGGRDLSDRLTPLRPDMKVLYMSGYTDNAIVHQGVLETDVVFIQKPFRTKKLIEKIREILTESIPQP
jgi:PAS domain S-box-containing protein